MSSCTPKVLGSSEPNSLLKEFFIQKEIPGQKDAKTYTYLNLVFNVEKGSNIFVNSIYFRGVTTEINSPSRHVKLRLNKEQFDNDPKTKTEEATLYYSIDGNIKTMNISNIQKKEAIYLP
jgi:hypothetical protein